MTRTASRGRSTWSRHSASPGSLPGGSGSRTRASGRSSAPEADLALGGAGPAVGEVEGIHPVANLGEALLAFGIRLGEVAILVGLGEDSGVVEHVVGDEDGDGGPDRDGDRVRRAGVDLQAATVDLGK